MEKRESAQSIINHHFGAIDTEEVIDCQHAVTRGVQIYCLDLAFKGKPKSLCPFVHKGAKTKCPYGRPILW